ncbi:hypothetical protein CD006_20590 [Enterobacter sp. 10-1]|nr:hypothetical protein [Raoultella sp. 10-1]PAC08988.1 hypothetical protein CD006_20590 [Enterobacter sp. 10-1]
MLVILFTPAIILYHFRHSPRLTRKVHTVILTSCPSFTTLIITPSWLYSSNHPLWHNRIGRVIVASWLITLMLLVYISRLRNIFWYSGAFFCSDYIFTLPVLIPQSDMLYSWYHARRIYRR